MFRTFSFLGFPVESSSADGAGLASDFPSTSVNSSNFALTLLKTTG